MLIRLPVPEAPLYVVRPGTQTRVQGAIADIAVTRLWTLWITAAAASALAAVIYWWAANPGGIHWILAFVGAAGAALIAGYLGHSYFSRRQEAKFLAKVSADIRPAIPLGWYPRGTWVSPENDWEAADLWRQMNEATTVSNATFADPLASRFKRREAKKLRRAARRYDKRIAKLLR